MLGAADYGGFAAFLQQAQHGVNLALARTAFNFRILVRPPKTPCGASLPVLKTS